MEMRTQNQMEWRIVRGQSFNPEPKIRPELPRGCTIYVLNERGEIIESNETISPLSGFSSDELIGTSFSQYFDEASRSWMEARLSAQNFEEDVLLGRLMTKEGEWREVQARFHPLVDERGGLAGVVVHVSRAPVEVRSEETPPSLSDYEKLLQCTSEAVIDFTSEGKIKFINSAGRQMFGYSDREIEAGLFVDRLFDSLEAKAFWKTLKEQGNKLSEGQALALFKRRNGRSFLGRFTAHQLGDEERVADFRIVVQEASSPSEVSRLGRFLEFAGGISRLSVALLDEEDRLLYADSSFFSHLDQQLLSEKEKIFMKELVQELKASTSPGPFFKIRATWPGVSVMKLGKFKVIVCEY